MDSDVDHHGNSGSFEADLLNWRAVMMMMSFIFTNEIKGLLKHEHVSGC